MIRNIFEAAGVHLYSKDGDLVYANAQYVTICANSGAGRKTLYLPQPSHISDALTGERLASNSSEYQFEAAHKETVMFHIQPA